MRYWTITILIAFFFCFSLAIISCSSEDDAALKDGKLASDISEADQLEAPSGSVLINNGDASTSTSLVSLKLSASDAGMVSNYYVSETNYDPVSSIPGWVAIIDTQNYSANIDFTLSAVGSTGEHTKTVYAWYKDTFSNVSSIASDDITLLVVDNTSPSNTTVIINDNDSSTTNTVVTLTLSASDDYGISAYYSSETNSTPSVNASGWNRVYGTSKFSSNVSFTLTGASSAGNHVRTVYVWIKDMGGNISSSASDNITLVVSDTTLPSSPGISINDNDSSTSNTNVILSLSATDNVGVTAYYLSELNTNPSSTLSGWNFVSGGTSFSDNVSFTLSSSSTVGSHSRTLYVWFKDAAGNVSTSASDGITLIVNDSTAPSSPSISINSGLSTATSANINLSLSSTDNVGVTAYYLSENSNTPSSNASGWISVSSSTSFSGNPSFTLSSGNKTNKIVYAWFKDSIGNVSSSANDSIYIDLASVIISNLEWEIATKPNMIASSGWTWISAIDYCGTLDLNSKQDWRLPTQSELISVVDNSISEYPRIAASLRDTTMGTASQSDKFSERYWSSNGYGSYVHGSAFWISYGVESYSTSSASSKDYYYRCRCVRSN